MRFIELVELNPYIKPSLCSHDQRTPAAVAPDCTSPPPAAPPAGTLWNTDVLAPRGRRPGPGPDPPERSAPGGPEGDHNQHGEGRALKSEMLTVSVCVTFSLIMSYNMVTMRVRSAPLPSALNSSDSTCSPPCDRK